MSEKLKRTVKMNVLSFSIPVILMLVAYAFLSIFPFGDKSLIVYWDMREQYTVFFEYLKTIFTGENNLFYTFSKFLGGDMIDLFAYYLASPFNILFLLLKNVDMAIMILILTLLKTGCCGLTFHMYLSKKFETSYTTLIFSTLYALSAYSIIYQQNIMWLDGMIFLPLVLIGIEKLVHSNRILCYIISLAVMIISNYYIGYMVGLFSILYFIYLILIRRETFDKNSLIKKIKLFLFGTITSVGATAVLLLPTLLALSGGKGPVATEESSLLNVENYITIVFTPLDILYRFFTGAFEWQDVLGGLPVVFCGLSTVILVILFFFNTKISKKEKMVTGIFLAFMVVSLQVNFLNIIWHGFNFPTGFPGRNSFMIIALMLLVAYKSFVNLKEGTTPYHVAGVSIILFLITLLVFGVRYQYYSFLNVLIPFFVINTTLVLLMLYIIKKDSKYQKIMIAGLAIICSVDVVANAYMCLDKYNYEDMNQYSDYYTSYKEVYDYIKEHDEDEFYRIEKDFRRVTNDAMMFNYNGLTSYSSSERDAVKEFSEKLGLDRFSTTYASYSSGSTMAMDCFLGVKYFLTHEEDGRLYEKLNTINNTDIYKNNYALPVGFVSGNTVKSMELDMDSANRFEIQNNIFKALTNSDDNILYPQVGDIQCTTDNIEITELRNYDIYRRSINSKMATIEFKFTVESEDPLYIDLYSPESNGAYLIVDGEVIENYFSTDDRDNLISLGKQPVGKEISIVINLSDRLSGSDVEMDNVKELNDLKIQELLLGDVKVYYEDTELVKEKCTELLEQPFEVEKLSSSHLKGTVNVQENDHTLLLTIPYEDSWIVEVDGVKVEPEQACDELMAVDVTKGEHTVELTYVPKGLYVGMGVSIISVIIILGYIIITSRKKRN